MKVKIETNITDEQLAAKAVCSIVTIRNAKKGASISHNTAIRIAKALKVNLADITIDEAA